MLKFYNSDNKVHVAHMGPVGPRWAPGGPHEPYYQGTLPIIKLTEVPITG